MSNAAYLLAVRADQPSADPFSTPVLRTGYDAVPPLWLACFRPGDLTPLSVPVLDASGREGQLAVDVLWTGRDKALANLKAFHDALKACPSMLRESEPCLLALARAIERSPCRAVQLHDVEIQMMVGVADNRPWVEGCLAFVDDIASARLSGDAVLQAPQALELFDQAQIQVPDWTCELDWEEALIGVSG